MASVSLERAAGARTGALLAARLADQGSASHPWFTASALTSGPEAARNLADAIHFLCVLHGRLPGIVELAATRSADAAARPWFADAEAAMALERAFLTRLAAAAGPIPGTPGGAESEAAVLAQRSALAVLAQSERNGCAAGAALAFVIDWTQVRTVLAAAATRFSVPLPSAPFPADAEAFALAEQLAAAPSIERALLFGAEQVALQHRALWDLLEARAQARAGA